MARPEAPSPVVGRETEVGALLQLLDAGRSRATALVVDGAAGIGKTTLFETGLEAARRDGFTVASCRPAEAELAYSFAALSDLLRPALPAGLGQLAEPQRRALAAALLLEEGSGPAPEERAIAFAVFQLLGQLARGPLLLAIDDVQWLDPASAAVLGFTIRRAAAAPIAILVARRDTGAEGSPLGLDRALPTEQLRHLRLGPLSLGATHRLLRARLGVSFPRPVLVELHRTAGGNPFYALELARALEQASAPPVAGRPLPV